MAENCPARRDLDSGSIRPVSAVNWARKFLLYVFFGLLLASCIGRGLEVPQAFFDPRPPAEWVFMNGKVVTVVRGLPARELEERAADLKRLCGAGGAVKDGAVEIQGDHRERIAEKLRSAGHTVKLAGG